MTNPSLSGLPDSLGTVARRRRNEVAVAERIASNLREIAELEARAEGHDHHGRIGAAMALLERAAELRLEVARLRS